MVSLRFVLPGLYLVVFTVFGMLNQYFLKYITFRDRHATLAVVYMKHRCN